MDTTAAEKYRNGLTVVRGAQSLPLRGRRRGGKRTRTAAELVLDRRLHTDFVQMGSVPSTAFEDIRRHRQHPWRVFARRMVEAHAAGVPLPAVMNVVRTLGAWVEQLYATQGETVTERVLFQSPLQVA